MITKQLFDFIENKLNSDIIEKIHHHSEEDINIDGHEYRFENMIIKFICVDILDYGEMNIQVFDLENSNKLILKIDIFDLQTAYFNEDIIIDNLWYNSLENAINYIKKLDNSFLYITINQDFDEEGDYTEHTSQRYLSYNDYNIELTTNYEKLLDILYANKKYESERIYNAHVLQYFKNVLFCLKDINKDIVYEAMNFMNYLNYKLTIKNLNIHSSPISAYNMATLINESYDIDIIDSILDENVTKETLYQMYHDGSRYGFDTDEVTKLIIDNYWSNNLSKENPIVFQNYAESLKKVKGYITGQIMRIVKGKENPERIVKYIDDTISMYK